PCPRHNVPAKPLVVNLALCDQVGDLLIRCRYGLQVKRPNAESPDSGLTSPSSLVGSCSSYEVDPSGCNAEIRLGNRLEHENSCPHSQAVCSRGCGLTMKLRDLQEHESVCGGNGTSCSSVCIRHLEEQLEQRTAESERLRVMLSGVVERLDRLDRHVTDRLQLLEINQAEHQDLLADSLAKQDRLQEAIVVVNELVSSIASVQPGGNVWQTFKCLGTFVGHRGPIWCLLGGGDYLYSASGDKSVKMWQVSSSNELLKTLDGHDGPVLSLALTGSVLFSGSQDNTIRVWDVAPASAEFGTCLKTLKGHTDSVSTLCVSKLYLFSGSFTLVKVWDLASRICLRTLTGFVRWVRALVVSQQLLYVGCGNSVLVIDLCNFSTVRSLCTDEEGNNTLSLLALVAAFYWFGKLWKNRLFLLLAPLQLLLGSASAIAAVETDGEHSNDEAAVPSSAVTSTEEVSCLSVMRTSAGLKLLSGSHDMSVAVWSLHNMLRTQTLQRHQGIVTAMAVCNSRLFTGSADCSMRVWAP
uniref:TRAF-type domain-containing protein n=1 Tax=Macrostomum lignano TaxID=282301 RepID=A0A1I8HIW0_9PLAT